MTEHPDSTLAEFVRACAEETPTPGGGSGSALVAATGAALGAMAARFTIGRKGYEAHGEVMTEAARHLDELREALLAAVDQDCVAYGRVAAAYRMPGGTAEQREARRAAIRDSTTAAMRVPLAAIRLCASGLARVAAIAGRVNRNLISDAGICALALYAGLEGLALNVRINAGALNDEAATRPVLAELAGLRTAAVRDRDRTLEAVDEALN